jgi:hypothetical protein
MLVVSRLNVRSAGPISEAQSLRATALQSMKWLTEDFSAEAMFISVFKSRWRLSAARLQIARSNGVASRIAGMHGCCPGKNRFVAQSDQCGDNLSVRFHIQNSISLTIAMLPRII